MVWFGSKKEPKHRGNYLNFKNRCEMMVVADMLKMVNE